MLTAVASTLGTSIDIATFLVAAIVAILAILTLSIWMGSGTCQTTTFTGAYTPQPVFHGQEVRTYQGTHNTYKM